MYRAIEDTVSEMFETGVSADFTISQPFTAMTSTDMTSALDSLSRSSTPADVVQFVHVDEDIINFKISRPIIVLRS